MKRNQRLSVQRAHFLSQSNRTEHFRQIEGRLPTGQEMMRAICVWCSVRSESRQRWTCRDFFNLTIDDRQKPNQDLYYFYSELMERYQDLYGAREPSDEMKASMHAHFYEQIRQVPRLEYAMQWYELSTDPLGTEMRTYQWLLLQGESLRMQDREQRAISEHESTLNSRNRQARLTGEANEGGGGGRRASAMAATVHRLGLPADKLASGRTKGETTCKFVKQGENCPEAGQGCPYNHKNSKTPASPAQPGAGGDILSCRRKE
eukprot:4891051-Pyramimonas_sp.AAC.1